MSNHNLEKYFKLLTPLALFALLVFNPANSKADSSPDSRRGASELGEPTRYGMAQSEIAAALQDLRYGLSLNLADNLSDGDEGQPLFNPIDAVNASERLVVGRKSPFKAGIMSFLIPGLGQVYNGSHLAKVGAFVGAEVALWSQYGRFNGIANDRIAAFESFADTTWNRQEYKRYLFDLFGDSSDAGNQFTHHLPGTSTQQYYEMIGKYDQFSYGWTLAEGDTGKVYTASDNYENSAFFSPLRLQYNDMRGSANDAFGSRDRMVIFALVNHLVSSVDAALGAARHNRALESGPSSFSISPSVAPDADWSIIPKVNVSYRF